MFLFYVRDELEGYGSDICIYHDKKGNIVSRIQNLTRFLVGLESLIQPHINIPVEIEEKLKYIIKGNIKGYKKTLHLNLSAADRTNFRSYFTRNVPVNILDKLLNFLKDRDVIVLTTAAPWDKDKFCYLKNKYQTHTNLNFIDTPDLYHLIGVVKMADLVVTPETSVVHIASALNKKLLLSMILKRSLKNGHHGVMSSRLYYLIFRMLC
ncbi:MAG: hypothetical protein NZ928_07420 [Endomicrobia bacterium]|nr:hypothetical protein [Endomicrobiia bacterium]